MDHPLFVLVWVGSVLAVIAAAALGLGQTDGTERLLMLAAAAAYLVGVQLPTAVVNVPLNNQLQQLNVEEMDAAAQRSARSAFEPRWNRSNRIRTLVAALTAAGLMILLALL